MNLLLALLAALPEVLKLIKLIQEKNDKAGVERKVAEDIERINEAFEKKDGKALSDIFNDG